MANRADALLQPLGTLTDIETKYVDAISPGAWIFLKSSYENVEAGFGAFGRRGKPAEEVAEDAVADLLAHHRSGAGLDRHLADQMLLPLALASDASAFTCPEVTRHLETNAWVIEQFGAARFEIVRGMNGMGSVKVVPNR
jgi:RNA 3'-terminal phosphate cyclase (ATP)